MNQLLLGIDIGFGDVKASINYMGERISIKFPTAITRQQRCNIKGLENPQDIFIYKTGKYIIGEDALGSQDIIPTRNIKFLKDFTPLFVFKVLCDVSKNFNISIENVLHMQKKICLGLPLDHFFSEKNYFYESIKQYSVSLIEMGRTNDYEIYFPNIDIRAQGQGVLTDFMIDKEGFKKKYEKSDIFVIDIGFNTVDVLSVRGGKASSHGSYMLDEKGVCKMTRELGLEIKAKTGTSLSEMKLKEVLLKKEYKIHNQPQDLNGSINQVIKEYTEDLIRELDSRSEKVIKDAEKMIIAGGGVNFIKKYISDHYPESFVHIPEDPEFANSRGYLKILEVN